MNFTGIKNQHIKKYGNINLFEKQIKDAQHRLFTFGVGRVDKNDNLIKGKLNQLLTKENLHS